MENTLAEVGRRYAYCGGLLILELLAQLRAVVLTG